MPTPITLVTLGSLGLSGVNAAGAAQLRTQPKRLAVLSFLAVAGRTTGPVPRDRVVDVFWPDSDPGKARNSLRQTISFIRRSLGEDAVLGVGDDGLAVGSFISCDAIRFEELIDAGKREEAMSLFGGDFLPGVPVVGSRAFAAWLDERRVHYRKRAAKAAWDLSADAESRGDVKGAAFWGKRALAHSPFSESEVQRLLRLLQRVEDFAGAMRAFAGLQNALRKEFGATPAAETERIVAGIRAHMDPNAVEFVDQRAKPTQSHDRRGNSGEFPQSGGTNL
jgi:DNA-binding SARP family transcriptional activator